MESLEEHVKYLDNQIKEIRTKLCDENLSDDEKKELQEKRKRLRSEYIYYYNESHDRCGYWGVCIDAHPGCGCSPNAKVSQGFDYDTYRSLQKERIDYFND